MKKLTSLMIVFALLAGSSICTAQQKKIVRKKTKRKVQKMMPVYQLLSSEDEKLLEMRNPKELYRQATRIISSRKQFKTKFRTLNPLFKRDRPVFFMKILPSAKLPYFSWRDRGFVTPAKNQRPYGTCWAFASISMLESAYYWRHRELLDLSEQDLIDCHCRNCDRSSAVQYKEKLKSGLCTDDEKKYKGDGNKPYCKPENCLPCDLEQTPYRIEFYAPINPEYSAKGKYPLTPVPVNEIKQGLIDHGPLVTSIWIPRGSKFGELKAGEVHKETIPLVYEPKRNFGSHIINIVGWDNKKQAWLIKNSWGTGWGDKGFGWIAWGSNKVGRCATWYWASAPNLHYTAVWRKSSKEEIQVHGWTYKHYRKKYDKLWNEGWRLYLLENTVKNNKVLYSAVWRKSTVGEYQLYGYSRQDYLKKYDEMYKKGWRLYILNNYVVNGREMFTAVFRKSNQNEYGIYGWIYGDFKKKYNEIYKNGWRLHILNNYILKGKTMYTAIFRRSNKDEYAVYGWKYNKYREKYDQLWKKGWRLHILNNYLVNGILRYTAVWRKTTLPEIQVYGWYYDDFRHKDHELHKSGWRLTMFNAY